MKPGDLIRTTHSTRLFNNPISGKVLGKYRAGTLFVFLDGDIMSTFHLKVLAPDGMTGWILSNVSEVINETG